MKVCIAEKPSVAREIASIIGAKTKHNGYYEGNGYQVSWTFGHLCTLKEPRDYNPLWKHWDLTSLPMIPDHFGIRVIPNDGVKRQFEIIEKLVAKAELIINCGDAGQEGELIQRWVLHKAKCKVPVKRLWISSLTEEAIREGFKNLKDGSDFDNLYAAGSSRAIGDWLLGINATRLYTLKYGPGKQVLSIGRVQTPTLALIVNRQNEIDNFKPQTYWELKTKYRDVIFNSTKGRFDTKEEGESFLKKIEKELFEVESVVKKEGREQAPRLFDLTSLQVDCNRKLAFSAEETLRIIQLLYEKKLTTYPRVDTTYLTDDIYPKVPGILQKLTPYKEFTDILLQSKIPKTKKVFDNKKVTDHHAIIPTGVMPSGLRYEEKQVYDMVTRRFISVFFPDCKVSNTTVMGKVENIMFKATGKQILSPGWRVVYAKDKTKKDAILPDFEKGEQGDHQPDFAEKQTQAPKYYSEGSLLRAMETAGKQVDDDELRDIMKENGIGRPSTRANIIETLFKRRYIKKEKKRLVATITGMQLIATIQNELLKSAELTGLWEKKLRDIERGQYKVKDFMLEMKEMVYNIVRDVRMRVNVSKIIVEEEEDTKDTKTASKEEKVKHKEKKIQKLLCPKCKLGEIVKGKNAWGCTNHKQCDMLIPFVIHSKKLSDKQLESIVLKLKTPKIKGIIVNEIKQNGIFILNDNFKLEFQAEEKKEHFCPICKTGKMLKGRAAWGCSNYGKSCKFIIPFEIKDKKLSEAQIFALIEKHSTPLIKGFIVDGEKISAKLIIDKDGKIILGKQ